MIFHGSKVLFPILMQISENNILDIAHMLLLMRMVLKHIVIIKLLKK